MKKDIQNGTCNVCKSCYWVFPLVILLIALVPGWLTTQLAKWILVLVAVLMLLKKMCPCTK